MIVGSSVGSDVYMKQVEGHQDGVASSLRERVEHVLALIRPAVVADGGDVELVDVTDDGDVTVRFHGACVGCPSSNITLQTGLERQLRDRLPEVSGVEMVT